MKDSELALMVVNAVNARKAAEALEEAAKTAFRKAMMRRDPDKRFVPVGAGRVGVEATSPRTFNEAFLAGRLDAELLDVVAPRKASAANFDAAAKAGLIDAETVAGAFTKETQYRVVIK